MVIMPPTTVSCLVGLGWNGVPVDETNRIHVLLEGLGYVSLLCTAHSWKRDGFGLVQQCLNDISPVRCWMVGLKIQILIRVVGLCYIEVLMELPSSLVRRMSKKESCPSDSFSTVNWMLLLMLLRWLWKQSTRSPASTVQVSSMYHLQKRGVWKVDGAFCSMSSITMLADTSDPMAVPCTSW